MEKAAAAASLASSQGKQALGRSKGGLSTKLHVAVTDNGVPLFLCLTPGQSADAPVGEDIALAFAEDPVIIALSGDKAYDSDAIRAILLNSGKLPVIPSKANRKVPIPHDEPRYKRRNVVERFIARIKEFRGISTRNAKLADFFLADIQLASAFYLLRSITSGNYLKYS